MPAELQPDGKVKVIVRMKEEADNSVFKQGKKEEMVDYLRSFARSSQDDLLATLSEYGNRVGNVRPFWIYNCIAMEATGDVIRSIMQREDVGYIEEDGKVTLFTKPDRRALSSGNRSVTWNIEIVKAPQAWDLGYTGKDIIIENIDSGVDALSQNEPLYSFLCDKGAMSEP